MSKCDVDYLLCHVANFLKPRLNGGGLLLLAFSGGSDSRALFEILHQLQSRLHFSLHLAHIDHSWRTESAAEAGALKVLAQQKNIPFHLKTLPIVQNDGTFSEEKARQARLQFFNELHRAYRYCAVLMAHHADDQAETVIKRLFESSSIENWGGMKPEVRLVEMPVWRPLLSIPKRALTAWLQNRAIDPLQDSSNRDTTYQRNRIRLQLIPTLTRAFGKDLTTSLSHIAQTGNEIELYLKEELQKELAAIQPGICGYYLPLSARRKSKEQQFMLKALIGHFALSTVAARPSQAVLNALCSQIQQSENNSRCHWHRCEFLVAKEGLFLFNRAPVMPTIAPPLELVTDLDTQWGIWRIKTNIAAEASFPAIAPIHLHWLDLWRGDIHFSIPHRPNCYYLRQACDAPLSDSSQKQFKRQQRDYLPPPLRALAPVLFDGINGVEQVVGANCYHSHGDGARLNVHLRYCWQ